MRAIIGQQVSVAGAITVLGRITHAAYRFPFATRRRAPNRRAPIWRAPT